MPDEIPYLETPLAQPSLITNKRPDGTIILSSGIKPAPYPKQLSEYLRHWAEVDPTRNFIAERDAQDVWQFITYGDMLTAANAVSQSLLDLGLTAARPVVSLEANAIDVAILKIATMQIGIPFVPISPSYSLLMDDYTKLRTLIDRVDPGLIFVGAVEQYKAPLAALDLTDVHCFSRKATDKFSAFETLTDNAPNARFDQAYDSVSGDTVAKFLFTSGSTGMPKAVITTQRMLCANIAGICQLIEVLDDHPPVVVDWLPWHHVAGGNKNFDIILRCGGTLYIDTGKPTPKHFERTITNLKDIQPTFLHNVPLVYELLVPYLEEDEEFARHLFGKMDFLFYAAAPLPTHILERLDAISAKVIGKRIPLLSSLGSTETTPSCILCHWPSQVPGNLGLPLPGVDIKLAPTAGRLEMRVKGPNITPGYYRDEKATKDAFDDEGFYRMGDAVKFIDEAHPELGLLFDGRITENFKLTSGTWVQVGQVRKDALATCLPLVQDAVVTGEGRNDLGLLLFLNLRECAKAFDLTQETSIEDLIENQALNDELKQKFTAFNAENTGSSRSVRRIMLMINPPSIVDNEITDKGYLNQRAILSRRAGLVEQLYNPTSENNAILIGDNSIG